jgi:hypothetical protein
MKSKELQQVLGKFLKSEAAGNARVQVVLNQEPRSLCLETLWWNHKALQRIKNHGAKRKRPEA